MNKKAIGLVLSGLIVGSSVTAFAAGGRTIEIFDNVKKIVVNKVNKPFNSNNAPFTYKGTTYVPLRYISESLGENVDWDGSTGTVYVGDRYNKTSHYWNKELYDMEYNGNFSYGYDLNKAVSNNINEKFTNYLKLDYRAHSGTLTTWVDFPLNGKYSKFNSRLSIPYDYRNFSTDIEVKILCDNKVAYKTIIKRGDMPKDISLDLTGSNKIRFSMTILSDGFVGSNGGVMFGNGEFIKK